MNGCFALSEAEASKLGPAWREFLATPPEQDAKKPGKKLTGPTIKQQNAWLSEHKSIRAELIEVGGEKFDISQVAKDTLAPVDKDANENATPDDTRDAENPKFLEADSCDITAGVRKAAELAGLTEIETSVTKDDDARGPARWKRSIWGVADPSVPYTIKSIETKRTSTRASAPFITSTLQQAASSRLGFGACRTMRAAQSLYEGVNIPGEGPVGLITYMRTDSTHLSGEAIENARTYVDKTFGDKYLPEKPNFFSSSNKAAQEAHEAIRPTDAMRSPDKVSKHLKADEAKLYRIIWERFVACQMTPAQWDSTTFLIEGGTEPKTPCVFKASGRRLAFDGHYRVSGVPMGGTTSCCPTSKRGRA